MAGILTVRKTTMIHSDSKSYTPIGSFCSAPGRGGGRESRGNAAAPAVGRRAPLQVNGVPSKTRQLGSTYSHVADAVLKADPTPLERAYTPERLPMPP